MHSFLNHNSVLEFWWSIHFLCKIFSLYVFLKFILFIKGKEWKLRCHKMIIKPEAFQIYYLSFKNSNVKFLTVIIINQRLLILVVCLFEVMANCFMICVFNIPVLNNHWCLYCLELGFGNNRIFYLYPFSKLHKT